MDKYFDIDEMMIEYSEMTGFDFNSEAYKSIEQKNSEYANKHIHSSMVITIALI